MMQKIEKLVDELTGAAVEVRTYYARLNGSELPLVGTVIGAKIRKPRAAKDAPVTAPATPAFDPMTDMGGAAAPAPTSAPAGMTEAESAIKAQEANKAIVKAFPTKQSDGMPEGFHKAKAILTEFGVARTTDLVHAQRIQYVAKLDALLAARAA